MKVICLVHNEFEDLELWYPVLRLRELDVTVHLAGEKAKQEYVGKHGIPAYSDLAFSEVNPEEYDGLLVPGGWAPDKLRRFAEVRTIVKQMHEHSKIIGQICHAGWVLISAGILKGKTITSTPAIKDDMVNAGATWLDQAVVVYDNIVSSRGPADLPDYMKMYIHMLLRSKDKTN